MNEIGDNRGTSLEEADEADPPQPSHECAPSATAANSQELLGIEIVHLAGDWSGFGKPEALINAAAAALSRHHALGGYMPAAAAVALSSDAHVKELNARHRGADKPTNVLSFRHGDDGVFFAEPGTERFLGDIVLAAETIAREAISLNTAPDHHLQHLIIHGLLHLIGYDHGKDDEARQMEALEIEILADLGIADPYAARAMPAAYV